MPVLYKKNTKQAFLQYRKYKLLEFEQRRASAPSPSRLLINSIDSGKKAFESGLPALGGAKRGTCVFQLMEQLLASGWKRGRLFRSGMQAVDGIYSK